jgi:hypothetical protein
MGHGAIVSEAGSPVLCMGVVHDGWKEILELVGRPRVNRKSSLENIEDAINVSSGHPNMAGLIH